VIRNGSLIGVSTVVTALSLISLSLLCFKGSLPDFRCCPQKFFLALNSCLNIMSYSTCLPLYARV